LNALPSHSGPDDRDVIGAIAEALRRRGYAVVPSALPPGLADALFTHLKSLGDGAFHAAGIGRQDDHQLNPFVRQDAVRWLDAAHPVPAAYLAWAESLRLGLNRRLFLGLFDYEAHYAFYPPGGFYRRHLDAFRGRTNRVVTTVLYLNPNWQPGHGGELVLYAPDDDGVLETVAPAYGTLVVFLSEDFPHQVLPTRRARHSIAGWFRVNTSLGPVVDPPR
jgi:SM-20-related protein